MYDLSLTLPMWRHSSFCDIQWKCYMFTWHHVPIQWSRTPYLVMATPMVNWVILSSYIWYQAQLLCRIPVPTIEKTVNWHSGGLKIILHHIHSWWHSSHNSQRSYNKSLHEICTVALGWLGILSNICSFVNIIYSSSDTCGSDEGLIILTNKPFMAHSCGWFQIKSSLKYPIRLNTLCTAL